MHVDRGGDTRTVVVALREAFRKAQASAEEAALKDRCFPPDMDIEGKFACQDDPARLFIIMLRLSWVRYRGRRDAHLLNGTYCLSDERFSGALTCPSIDLHGPHPGEGWEEIVDSTLTLPGNCVLSILRGASRFEVIARQALGDKHPVVSPGS